MDDVGTCEIMGSDCTRLFDLQMQVDNFNSSMHVAI